MAATSSTTESRGSNSLLDALDAAEDARLLEGAEIVELELRAVLYEANAPIRHVVFPFRGVASIIAPVGDGASVEVGDSANVVTLSPAESGRDVGED